MMPLEEAQSSLCMVSWCEHNLLIRLKQLAQEARMVWKDGKRLDGKRLGKELAVSSLVLSDPPDHIQL